MTKVAFIKNTIRPEFKGAEIVLLSSQKANMIKRKRLLGATICTKRDGKKEWYVLHPSGF